MQACFDTLPQERIVRLVNRLLLGAEEVDGGAGDGAPDYVVSSTAVVHPPAAAPGGPPKPRVRLRAGARRLGDASAATAPATRRGARGAVVVAPLRSARHGAAALARTLRQHVGGNVVRLAGRLCVQRRGIAQGGVASGLLAALAYGEGLEAPGAPLGELCARRDVCVIRGVDDFLVVSAERESVESCLRTMAPGVPEVGVSANRENMAVNLDVEVEGQPVRKIEGGRFPFCGMLVDTRTLDVLKSSDALDPRGVGDGLTVETAARPGHAFRSRMVNALRLQMAPALLDPRLLSTAAVLENVHHATRCAALRVREYARALPRGRGGAPARALAVRTLAAPLRVAGGRAAAASRRAAGDPLGAGGGRPAEGPARAMVRWTACAALAAGLAGGGGGAEMGAALAWVVTARDREWRACTRGQRRVLGAMVGRARSL